MAAALPSFARPDAASQALFDQACARRLRRRSAAPLVVALSGGSDSLALLALTCAWGASADRAVVAVTVDHQLQPQSAAWARAAGEAAAAAGAGFRSLAWTGPKPATGLPAAARAARHRLIAEAARDLGAGVILLGHTRDDVMETALMREAGSSLGALAEWSPSPVWPQGRGLFHFRPLLDVRRADLRQGLREAGQGWIEDPANQDLHYARSRARAALALGTAAAPLPAAPVGELARLALQVTPEAWGFSLDRGALLAAPAGIAAQLLSAVLVCAAGQERLPRPQRVRALLDRLRRGESFAASLAGARLEAADRLWLMREAGERRRGRGEPPPVALIAGQAVVWDGRFEIVAEGLELDVRPLAGLAGRLADGDRARLKALPPAARLSLPTITGADGTVCCPVLAERRSLVCRALWPSRLLAACGVIAREA